VFQDEITPGRKKKEGKVLVFGVPKGDPSTQHHSDFGKKKERT
jgi:hypothetical protein